MQTTNRFKSALAGNGPVPLGTWLMTGAPGTVEAIGHCGFDFLVADMEHVPIDVAQLPDILRAVAVGGASAITRLAWNDHVLIKRALDAGAETIMLPFVETAEEARAAVTAAKYPPLGRRGVAAVQRASRYGAVPGYFAKADDEVCVIVQLETAAAVQRLPEIAAVPGIDAVFIGPNDLAASMGHIGDITDVGVQDLLRHAAATASEVGTPVGIVGPTVEMVRRFIGWGYRFAAVGSDMAFMTTRARSVLAEMRADA